MSLRVRAMLILGGIKALTLLIIIGLSLGYMYRSGLNQAQTRAEDAVRLIRASVAESMFVFNNNSAAEVIDSAFSEIPDLTYLKIADEHGAMIAEKRKGSDLSGDNIICLRETIELGSINFGTLYLHYSTAAVSEWVKRQSWVLGSFALLGMAISNIITWFAVGKLGDVLAAMEQGLHEMARSAAPESLPIPPGQELGRLVTAYNRLIERLHPS